MKSLIIIFITLLTPAFLFSDEAAKLVEKKGRSMKEDSEVSLQTPSERKEKYAQKTAEEEAEKAREMAQENAEMDDIDSMHEEAEHQMKMAGKKKKKMEDTTSMEMKKVKGKKDMPPGIAKKEGQMPPGLEKQSEKKAEEVRTDAEKAAPEAQEKRKKWWKFW